MYNSLIDINKERKTMLANVELRYKKEISGPESDFINSFLSNYKQEYSDDKKTMTIFSEPFVGSGFPDLVMVRWDNEKPKKWNEERNNISNIDLKIIHHMMVNPGIYSIENLKLQLGYSEKIISGSVQRMKDAGLIREDKKGLIRIGNKKELFFIQSIIAIEAKMKNWKKAFIQAEANQWFSSESYVLLPDFIITEAIISHANLSTAGLISFGDDGIKILKKPEKRKMPVSFCSWIFNENIGRSLWGDGDNYGFI